MQSSKLGLQVWAIASFSGRHNDREVDTIDQMARVARSMVGKRLRYQDLTAYRGRAARRPEKVLAC